MILQRRITVFAAPPSLAVAFGEMAFDMAAAVGVFGRAGRAAARSRRANPGFDRDGYIATLAMLCAMAASAKL